MYGGSVVVDSREDVSQLLEPVVVSGRPPVGLKLEVSPEILPRDTSIGTKIFTLVPNEARNVREVKTYLANFVLKTPAPFQVFVGEYRILDEEDVQIFSLINEPCRLLPVPKPRPALSSTPKVKAPNVNGSSSSGKRVTFFDGDLSASPVQRCDGVRSNGGMSMDVLDQPHTLSSRPIHATPIQLPSNSNGVSNAVQLQNNGNDASTSGGSEERKKRRRRRHRNKKSKSSKSGSGSDPEVDDGELEVVKSEQNAKSGNSTSERKRGSTSEGNRQESLDVLNEDTESEEETTSGEIATESADDQFNFVTPSSVVVVKRQIKTENAQIATKRAKLSDSAFSSPGSFLSPVSSEGLSSSGKVRQDTPIPRVIRNPRVFDAARKIINDFGIGDNSNEMIGSNVSMESKASEEIDSDLDLDQMALNEKNDNYSSLTAVKKLDDLNKQDKIAFRVLELDEHYNPCISTFKEGIVLGKAGGALTIQYTKNEAKPRSGKYEFSFCESEDEESGDCSVVLHFAELIEPKLIHRSLSV